jgi:hypothetical protein
MCATCHGAPGVAPEEWAEGLRPAPPALSEMAGALRRRVCSASARTGERRAPRRGVGLCGRAGACRRGIGARG